MDDRIRYNREEVQCIWEDLFYQLRVENTQKSQA